MPNLNGGLDSASMGIKMWRILPNLNHRLVSALLAVFIVFLFHPVIAAPVDPGGSGIVGIMSNGKNIDVARINQDVFRVGINRSRVFDNVSEITNWLSSL